MKISNGCLNPDLPPMLWVVTRERVRAGKPPFKIIPINWIGAFENIRPWAVMANKTEARQDGTLYPISQCFISIEDAISEISQIISTELYYERNKLQELKAKLRNSMDAAKKITNN